MTECKTNLIELFEFFDGYFNTDFRCWIIPWRYRKAILKSMKVYDFTITLIKSIKDETMCKIVNNDDKRTLAFVMFRKGRMKTR